jgi:hypothetical protein
MITAALLTDRAVAVAPDFTLSEENCQAAGEICRRLDGLPRWSQMSSADQLLNSPHNATVPAWTSAGRVKVTSMVPALLAGVPGGPGCPAAAAGVSSAAGGALAAATGPPAPGRMCCWSCCSW